MNDTIVYLVRHAETALENGIRNTNEDSQMINEKEILSIEGEEQAKKLSENVEFMKDKNTRDPSQEQLLDRTFKTSDGESAEQTREKMN